MSKLVDFRADVDQNLTKFDLFNESSLSYICGKLKIAKLYLGRISVDMVVGSSDTTHSSDSILPKSSAQVIDEDVAKRLVLSLPASVRQQGMEAAGKDKWKEPKKDLTPS